MARGLLKNIAALASGAAVFLLAAALLAWMIARVAEHPGVPRDAGKPPPWFTGEAGAVRETLEHSPVAPAPATGAQSGAAATGGDFVEVAGGSIEIALTEYEMKPGRIRTKPGTVVFVLRNEGRFAHNFHVEGPGVDTTAEKFSPGRTVRLQVTLQQGEYKISCPLSNHDQRGMHGTLIATSRPAGRLTADERR
ncbi:MAG: cupredoxin domain-containing protein [Betaproteobacteria bacterium]|nr:cupredoxin domain-containing protein [Betaproteobacteria bacterium]